MEKFYSSDVAIYTGITKPILEYWIGKDWVRPSIQTKAESGTENIFSRIDLYHIAFIKKVKESGFSPEMANEKINIYPICEADVEGQPFESIGIAFSRVMGGSEEKVQGAWIMSSTLDRETGWNSYALIEKRLQEGATDFYILNFSLLKEQIDSMIDDLRK